MFYVYMIESDALMVGRPKGVLDAGEATRIVEFIEVKELELESGFDRFCDLTSVERVDLSYADLETIAARRRVFNPNDYQVKSAFLATHPLAWGMAHMYKKLLNSPRIEVAVFNDLDVAAKWLEVKTDRLKL